MRLTRFSDYAVRVMLYLAAHDDRLCSISEIAKAYDISQNHLMKVVSDLAGHGYILSQRGRSGGIRLASPPEQINIGRLIRHTEGEIDLVGCADCRLRGACTLPGPLDLALNAFFAVLERYTLAEVMGDKGAARLLEQLSARA
ncbi:MAG: Rrf2 family transcriptional regulator [Sphingomonadales bacterium]|nr:Rrf2 family transcriptional regulator [Sphingomonadales bacterium]MDE2171649.1 Rrf2 family transcriptional regulator [Sphingomonadales bacterium]